MLLWTLVMPWMIDHFLRISVGFNPLDLAIDDRLKILYGRFPYSSCEMTIAIPWVKKPYRDRDIDSYCCVPSPRTLSER